MSCLKAQSNRLFICRYDEGTAFMPVVPYKRLLPVSDKYPFLALDADGYDLPSDWWVFSPDRRSNLRGLNG